jgi:hypothetical protein
VAARVRARVWPSGICRGQSGTGAGFLPVLRFPLPIFIPPNSPFSQSPGADTIGQKWPTCRVVTVWTPPLTVRIKKNLKHGKTDSAVISPQIRTRSLLLIFWCCGVPCLHGPIVWPPRSPELTPAGFYL